MTLRSAQPEDDLLKALLGAAPLTAQTTVIPFITTLLKASDPAAQRSWLIDALRLAVMRPETATAGYRPVQQRADQSMATYSFNLTLLALACGDAITASEVFPEAEDAAGELRALALRWRASIHSDTWFSSRSARCRLARSGATTGGNC